MRRVTVFGANGKVGTLVTQGLLQRGYHVTAFVHSPGCLEATDTLKVIAGDVHDKSAVENAVSSSDAVISALGSWGTLTKDIQVSGMKAIIPAMKNHGVRRLISLTGSEARATGDAMGFVHRMAHFAASIAAGKILEDGEKHIELLENSGLDWTVIRSPVMTTTGTATYTLSLKRPQPWRTIHRDAVAISMLAQLDDLSYKQRAPFISR